MSLIHTLSASVLHGINESNNGVNRSHLASCLGKLNPTVFSRPHAISSLMNPKTAAAATVGDPTVSPIDVIAVKASTCRESMFAEYEAIRQQRSLAEIGRAGGGDGIGGVPSAAGSDIVELATTTRQRQMERNPFSRHSETKLRRFACTSFNGCEIEADEGTSANLVFLTSSASFSAVPPQQQQSSGSDQLALAPYAKTVRNRKNVYYRSPWSNLHQSIIDVPSITRALHDEVEVTPSAADNTDGNKDLTSCHDAGAANGFGGGGGRASGITSPVTGDVPQYGQHNQSPHIVCPIFVRYQKEAMALFSNKQITQYRHIADTFSSPERVIAARNVEAQLNAMLSHYMDAYYVSAVEMPTAVNTTSAGGAARLGPAPRNAYGETIKTHANVNDHEIIASSFVRDYAFERAGQARQHVLEVNTVIRNRVKVDAEDEWAGEFDSEDDGNEEGEEEDKHAMFDKTQSGTTEPSLRRLQSSNERVMRLAFGPTSALTRSGGSSSRNDHQGLLPLPTSPRRKRPKPPHRSWTAVHTATVRQHNKEVKIAMASRLLLRQTTRAPVATVLHTDSPAQRTPSAHDHQDHNEDAEDFDLRVSLCYHSIPHPA